MGGRVGQRLGAGVVTPLESLQCRHDGPIPERERDAVRYQTRTTKIARAEARVRAAETHIAQRKEIVRLMAARMRDRGTADAVGRLAREMMRTHGPHIQYWARERRRWTDHLYRLEHKLED